MLHQFVRYLKITVAWYFQRQTDTTIFYMVHRLPHIKAVQCFLQFCGKLVDIAGRKIGIINLVVILVIFLPLFVHKHM